jgi:hypothetical protein
MTDISGEQQHVPFNGDIPVLNKHQIDCEIWDFHKVTILIKFCWV